MLYVVRNTIWELYVCTYSFYSGNVFACNTTLLSFDRLFSLCVTLFLPLVSHCTIPHFPSPVEVYPSNPSVERLLRFKFDFRLRPFPYQSLDFPQGIPMSCYYRPSASLSSIWYKHLVRVLYLLKSTGWLVNIRSFDSSDIDYHELSNLKE